MIRRLIFSSILLASPATVAWTQPAPLTLQAVLDAYVANNLELQAAKFRLERTTADQIAARLRLNPGVTVTGENLRVNGPVPFRQLYEVAVSYAETFELGGKRKLRANVADSAVSVGEMQFADAMRRGIADVKRLYYEALVARYSVDIAGENRQTFEQLVQFNLARFREGLIPEADLIRVRLERIKFDTAIKQAQLDLRRATIRLLERLGESTFSNREIAGEIDRGRGVPELESLTQIVLSQRPDIQAAEHEVNAANERLALERARSRADITPFIGYKRLASDNTILLGFSMPLKIRDRNEAGIARAEADKKFAETQLRMARNRSLAEVEVAYAAFQTAREQVQTFRDELLNEADESRTIALAAYQEGGTPLLPVLDAQRTRSEVRQQYFRILFDYQISVIDLELAVGKDFQP
ncbi:MAG TPA: TolC family protein [Terriglobia bacterium]|nr:TolC family protein [Terriglobia bacterium]